MITFYPGPSKIDERIPEWLQEGMESGILSANHRSEAFMQQYSEIVDLLREVFYLPEEYEVYFISSATECWEIISQSFAGNSFMHLYNGAFGEKWYQMNTALGNTCRNIEFKPEEFPPEIKNLEEDIICLCHNETSNGSRIPDGYMSELRNDFPDKIIAIDATSSMAGVMLPWLAADIWFASVQKCFGLPAGMGIMFCHKKVLERIGQKHYYNHIGHLHKHYMHWQTTHTPNVANVYFLWQHLQNHKGLDLRSEKIKKRAKHLYRRLEDLKSFELIIKNEELRSDTVIAVEADENVISGLKDFLENEEIIIGKGYGIWKNKSFRIANFPAIKREEYEALFDGISRWQESG